MLLRKARSALLLSSRALANRLRLARLRFFNDVQVGRGITIDADVQFAVTDGGTLVIGDGVHFGRFCYIVVSHGTMAIGARTHITQGSIIAARERIDIGSDCLIGEYVTIRDQDHAGAGYKTTPVLISSCVWIGAKASVLRGSRIGEGAVIGAHALVKGSIPANTTAVGVPARHHATLE